MKRRFYFFAAIIILTLVSSGFAAEKATPLKLPHSVNAIATTPPPANSSAVPVKIYVLPGDVTTVLAVFGQFPFDVDEMRADFQNEDFISHFWKDTILPNPSVTIAATAGKQPELKISTLGESDGIKRYYFAYGEITGQINVGVEKRMVVVLCEFSVDQSHLQIANLAAKEIRYNGLKTD